MSLGTSHKHGREEIVADMAAHSGEMLEEMYRAALAAAPVYRTADDSAFLEQVRHHCAEHVRLFLACAADDRVPTEPELEFVHVRGRLRAREHLPVEAMMQTYLAGQRATWAAVRDASARTHATQSEEESLTVLTFRYAEVITAALAEAYGAERRRQTGSAQQLQRDLVDDVLGGRVDAGDDRIAALGLDPSKGLRVAVIEVDPAPDAERAATAIGLQLAASPTPGFAIDHAEEVVAVLQSPSAEPLAAAVRRAAARLESGGVRLRAGISLVSPDAGALRPAYEDARRVLRHTSEPGTVTALDEIGLIDVLAADADATAARMASDTLGSLADDPGTAETLAAYADAGLNVQRAAAALGVHPNTVHYRLDRVRERSGRDPRRFHDLADLLLALRLGAPHERRAPRR